MKYEITLTRKSTAYRMMTVEATSPESARRRALAIIRYENGADSGARETEADDPGEWCDDSYGRPVVRGVQASR